MQDDVALQNSFNDIDDGQRGSAQASVAEVGDSRSFADAMSSILGHVINSGTGKNAPATPGNASESSGSVADDESESEGDDGVEEQYFAVRANPEAAGSARVEMDVIDSRCRELRSLMRQRPTLPPKAAGAGLTSADLEVA